MVQSDSAIACIIRKQVKLVTRGLKLSVFRHYYTADLVYPQEGVTAKTFESHCSNYSSQLHLREGRL